MRDATRARGHGRKWTCQLLVGWIHQIRLSGGRKPFAILALRGVADCRQQERVQTCTDLQSMDVYDDECTNRGLHACRLAQTMWCVQTGLTRVGIVWQH